MKLVQPLWQCFSTGLPRNPGFRERLPGGFRWNKPKLPWTKFRTTVLCGCSSIAVSQLHRVPWATQTFVKVSVAAKRLKNTALL